MNQIYFLEVEPGVECGQYLSMLPYVSEYKREALRKKRYEFDRKMGIFADILLRCVLSRHLGKHSNDLNILVSSSGKPYLIGHQGVEFNLSHTKNAIVVALSDAPVGIDIEKIREIDFGIADRFFTEKELTWLREPGADQMQRFFMVWTRKEALLKYEGVGLSGGLKTHEVLDEQLPIRLSSMMEKDYMISACASEVLSAQDILKLTEAKLFELWQECGV